MISIRDGLKMPKVDYQLVLDKTNMANKWNRRSLMMIRVSNHLEWTCSYLSKSKSRKCKRTTFNNSNRYKRWWFRCKSLSNGHSTTSKPKLKILKRKWTKIEMRRKERGASLTPNLKRWVILLQLSKQISQWPHPSRRRGNFSNPRKLRVWIVQMQCTAKMVQTAQKYRYVKRMRHAV